MIDMAVLHDYENLEYPVMLQRDEEGKFIATYPDLPGVIASGDILEEVLFKANELRLEWIGASLEMGWNVPLPGEGEKAAGTLTVRLPKSIHRSLKLKAKAEGVSLNMLAATALAREVGREC
jgi:antitoxin HicB